MKSVIFNNKNR